MIGAWDLKPGMGLVCVCTASPAVIRAALHAAKYYETFGTQERLVSIEATCNQINPTTGYSGLTPKGFASLVGRIAGDVGLSRDKYILGGDHLGPYPWRNLKASDAMRHAKNLVGSFALAGYDKIHVDPSMRCAGDPDPLPIELIAQRAATLIAYAEDNVVGLPQKPRYVIGAEVPIPGGGHSKQHVRVSAASDIRHSIDAHYEALKKLGLEDVWKRVVATVVEPGVEFGDDWVVHFNELAPAVKRLSSPPTGEGFVGLRCEVHSTDYQTPQGLKDLVGNGFQILKVGPELTYELRRILYRLDFIWDAIYAPLYRQPLPAMMADAMKDNPTWLNGAYPLDKDFWKAHVGLTDRVRYYWNDPAILARTQALQAMKDIPINLVRDVLPELEPKVRDAVSITGAGLVQAGLGLALDPYMEAAAGI